MGLWGRAGGGGGGEVVRRSGYIDLCACVTVSDINYSQVTLQK